MCDDAYQTHVPLHWGKTTDVHREVMPVNLNFPETKGKTLEQIQAKLELA